MIDGNYMLNFAIKDCTFCSKVSVLISALQLSEMNTFRFFIVIALSSLLYVVNTQARVNEFSGRGQSKTGATKILQ